MPRHRGKIGVDLFPFLSVLCSVIGVMMLMMMFVMSTRVIEATPTEPPPPPPGQKGIEDGVDQQTYDGLDQEIGRLETELNERLQQRDALLQQYQRLLAVLDEKRTQLDVPDLSRRRKPIELDRGIPVEVEEDPEHAVDKQPTFVEVRAEGYLVHPSKESFPAITLGDSSSGVLFEADPALARFLRAFSKRSGNEYLVLLIHPNGTEAFSNLRRYIRSKNYLENPEAARGGEIELGWEPFSREWEVIVGSEQ